MHLRGFLDGFDGDLVDEGGFFVVQRGLFECGRLLEVGDFAAGEGEEGLGLAFLHRGVKTEREVGDARIGVEAVRFAVVEVRELHRLVEALDAGGGEGAVLLTIFANALAAEVDVPGQALRGLATDDLMQRIVFIHGDGQADFECPMIVRDVRGDFGFRIPAELLPAWCCAIEIDDVTGGADGDLVVAVRFSGDFELDGIAVPDGLIVFACGSAHRLLAASLIASNGKDDVAALPAGFERGAKGGCAAGLQLAELARSGCGADLPIFVIEFAVDDDAFRIADEAQRGHGSAFLAELHGFHAQAFEEVVDEGEALLVDL